MMNAAHAFRIVSDRHKFLFILQDQVKQFVAGYTGDLFLQATDPGIDALDQLGNERCIISPGNLDHLKQYAQNPFDHGEAIAALQFARQSFQEILPLNHFGQGVDHQDIPIF